MEVAAPGLGEGGRTFLVLGLDSYFARDVQELFRLEKRAALLSVLELLLRQSSGMLDVTKLATESQISRPTVTNWLEIYQITHVVHLVRPFSAGGRREKVSRPVSRHRGKEASLREASRAPGARCLGTTAARSHPESVKAGGRSRRGVVWSQ